MPYSSPNSTAFWNSYTSLRPPTVHTYYGLSPLKLMVKFALVVMLGGGAFNRDSPFLTALGSFLMGLG
jgi:hypothetical protein